MEKLLEKIICAFLAGIIFMEILPAYEEGLRHATGNPHIENDPLAEPKRPNLAPLFNLPGLTALPAALIEKGNKMVGMTVSTVSDLR